MFFFLWKLLTCLSLVTSYDKIVFYPGSRVDLSVYQPFLTNLQTRTGLPCVSVKRNPWISSQSSVLPIISNETPNRSLLLIGHSMGGIFALWESLRCPEKVGGVILLQSHFNSVSQMPYPCIDSYKFPIPTLCVWGEDDQRLPFEKAIQDLYYSISARDLDSRQYRWYAHCDHFTCFTNATLMSTVLQDIHTWMSQPYNRSLNSQDPLQHLPPEFKILSRTQNLLDTLLRLVVPYSLWQTCHWIWFLSVKIHTHNPNNYLYETKQGHILAKLHPNQTHSLHPNTPLYPKHAQNFIHILQWIFIQNTSLSINQYTTYYHLPPKI